MGRGAVVHVWIELNFTEFPFVSLPPSFDPIVAQKFGEQVLVQTMTFVSLLLIQLKEPLDRYK